MKITLQAKQLVLLLLILILDNVFKANATSYKSHSGYFINSYVNFFVFTFLFMNEINSFVYIFRTGGVLTTQRQTLRSPAQP